MLNLASATETRWKEAALAHLDDILLDHAHCEKKAASMALNLIFRYPEYPEIVVPLSQLAREELAHFEQVIALMKKRGLSYIRQKPSAYGGKLFKHIRKDEPLRAVDTFLCCSLVEARSCERMQMLAEALEEHMPQEQALIAMYRGLLASEARHHTSYVDMARQTAVLSEAELRKRLSFFAEMESEINAFESPELRMHNMPLKKS